MTKVKKTFRIEEKTAAHLLNLADAEGVTATEILERAIRAYGSKPYACHTPEEVSGRPPIRDFADDATSAAVAALTEQLAVKDRQIADLSAALVSAQKSVEQAHALHAADKQAALTEPAEEPAAPLAADPGRKVGRWQRLKDAWRA